MEHQEEIINTRVGGLGSSDAKMVVAIAERGQLNHSDRQRIAVMLGLAEKRQFTTKAIELGNIVEDAVFDVLKGYYGDNITSNPRYTINLPVDFRVSNHIDFEISTDDTLIWVEHKSTIHGINQALEDYKYQLAWHAMLGTDKALGEGKKFKLFLSHYDTNDFNGTFDASKFGIVEVTPNQHYIDKISKGLLIINEVLPTFEWSEDEGICHASQLPQEINDKCQQIADYLRHIKELTEQVDTFKTKMCELMTDNNVKSIITDHFTITLVEQSVSTTFDKKKFEKEHPELVGVYEKKSVRKPYVTIKI